MSVPNDGNETDFRLNPEARPYAAAFEALRPVGVPDDCATQKGTQTDIPAPPGSGSLTGTDIKVLFDPFVIGDVCPEGFDIQSLDKFIMSVLINHFASSDTIIIPELKQYVYTSGADSKIGIVTNTFFNLTTAELTPTIVLKRGLQKTDRITIGDRGENYTAAVDFLEDYVEQISGTHTLMALSATDGTADLLGMEIYYLFKCLSPIFRKELPFLDFRVLSIGEVGIADSQGSQFIVPVQLGYVYENGWTIRYVSPRLGATSGSPTIGV